jgi:Putative Flp pilus-assembly TadE/G-like
MRRRERYRRGQMAVVMTFAIATLLGAMALGTDIGVLYFNWMQLQKGADAAALAGAGEYGPQTPPAPKCQWSAVSSPAQNAACDYALSNGIKKSEIQSINAPALNLPASSHVPTGGPTVQVLVQRTNIPIYFGRVLGLSNPSANAVATAVGPTPIQTLKRGLFPVGIQYPAALTYGTPTILSENSGVMAPGNWRWLDFPQCSPVGSNPPASYNGGGVPNLVQNISNGSTCAYSVGDSVSPQTGANANSSNTATAISNLIGVPTGVVGALAPSDPNQIKIGDPQLVIVPMVDWNGAAGATAIPIKGFAAVWITELTGQGTNITLYGQFVQVVDRYGQGGASTNWGAYAAPFLVE